MKEKQLALAYFWNPTLGLGKPAFRFAKTHRVSSCCLSLFLPPAFPAFSPRPEDAGHLAAPGRDELSDEAAARGARHGERHAASRLRGGSRGLLHALLDHADGCGVGDGHCKAGESGPWETDRG